MARPHPDLKVAPALRAFIETEVLRDLDLKPDRIWSALAALLAEFMPRNAALLAERARLEDLIDRFHASQGERSSTIEAQEAFLRDIGYLLAAPAPFQISTSNVDPELAALAGPQLVVPGDNARYVLNAANARWGSLFDALYGTDAMGGRPPPPGAYDAMRGGEVVAWAKAYLDDIFPLSGGSHRDVVQYSVCAGALATNVGGLARPETFAGYRGPPDMPAAILLRTNGLHVEISLDRDHFVGRGDPAGIYDIVVESALSAIVDFEDAVAAVDAADKIGVYRNWLGLMRGDLAAIFTKQGAQIERGLNDNRVYVAPDGSPLTLKGRALLLVRNVGHLMTTSMVQYQGREAPEGIIDAFVTALVGRHDVDHRRTNSATGSIYVVKPKMHGPSEAAFARDLFAACEALAGLAPNTMKIGVMDEERRTSLNLAAVIEAVRERIVFTNTGFLDRTGDEIHTAMFLGPVLRKDDMKSAPWLQAYEANNVAVALACGFSGRAQIGKGMWTAPDRMHDMLAQKIAHPMSGASTAWVPNPTTATLHALHYHRVDVRARQAALLATAPVDPRDMLRAPIAWGHRWTADEISNELDDNVQSILGYVSRWIDQGVGCSKVANLAGVALMEDRATCRISSQTLANWLRWNIISEAQLTEALGRMAVKVDQQNVGDPKHTSLGGRDGSIVVDAARRLILGGALQINGYTEPVLHTARRRRKSQIKEANVHG